METPMTKEQAGRRERITLAVTPEEKAAVKDVASRMPQFGGEGPLLRHYRLDEILAMHRQQKAGVSEAMLDLCGLSEAA
jgi:hypothetical protein